MGSHRARGADISSRRESEKRPTLDLLNNFKATFPRFDSGYAATSAPEQEGQVVTDSLDLSVNPRYA